MSMWALGHPKDFDPATAQSQTLVWCEARESEGPPCILVQG